MKTDQAYLDQVADQLVAQGFQVEKVLALGDPATGKIKLTEEKGVNLVAMSTHGHRFVSDLL